MEPYQSINSAYNHTLNSENFQHYQPQFSQSMFQQNEIEFLGRSMEMHKQRAIRAETILIEDFFSKRRTMLKSEEEQEEKDIIGIKELYSADSARYREKHKCFIEKIKLLDDEQHNLNEIELLIKNGLKSDRFMLDDLRQHGYPDDFNRLKIRLIPASRMNGHTGAGDVGGAFSFAGSYGQTSTVTPSSSWNHSTAGQLTTEALLTQNLNSALNIRPSSVNLNGAELHVPNFSGSTTANSNGIIGSEIKSNSFVNVEKSSANSPRKLIDDELPQHPRKSNEVTQKAKVEKNTNKSKDVANEKSTKQKVENEYAEATKSKSEKNEISKNTSKSKGKEPESGTTSKASKKSVRAAAADAAKAMKRNSPASSLALSDTGSTRYDLEDFVIDLDDFELQRALMTESKGDADWSSVVKSRPNKPKAQKPLQLEPVAKPPPKELVNPEDHPAYKIQLCAYYETDRFCIRGNKCQYAHGEKDLRKYAPASHPEQVPSVVKPENPEENPAYKTRLCTFYGETGQCFRGDTCQYAHGAEELRRYGRVASESSDSGLRSFYKTRLCKNWQEGSHCLHSERCVFAHGEEELQKYVNASSTFNHEEPCDNQQCPQRLSFLLFKTKECDTPVCPRDALICRFAHDKTELRPMPKFEMCEQAQQRRCHLPSAKCVYAHFNGELREEPVGFWEPCKKSKNQDDECMICGDLLNSQTPRFKLNCSGKHSNWHFSCISQWVNKQCGSNGTCPMCREPVEVPTSDYPDIQRCLNQFIPTSR